jgi:hypothetical protein
MNAEKMAYGSAMSGLVDDGRLNELGPGRPDVARRDALAALTPQALVAPHPLRDRDMANCCLAGLWLAHDFLDQSHRISQEIATRSGSYWHGIMHRREPDFGNSKYWFRRVGRHPVFAPLCAAARQLAAAADAGGPAAALAAQSEWDPFLFVDLCQQAMHASSPLNTLCRQVQKREWQLLFEYCFVQAAGR